MQDKFQSLTIWRLRCFIGLLTWALPEPFLQQPHFGNIIIRSCCAIAFMLLAEKWNIPMRKWAERREHLICHRLLENALVNWDIWKVSNKCREVHKLRAVCKCRLNCLCIKVAMYIYVFWWKLQLFSNKYICAFPLCVKQEMCVCAASELHFWTLFIYMWILLTFIERKKYFCAHWKTFLWREWFIYKFLCAFMNPSVCICKFWYWSNAIVFLWYSLHISVTGCYE